MRWPTDQFDLVLMDLNMPVMGGLDAVKLHRFATGGRDVPPFVALTADATEETRRAVRGRPASTPISPSRSTSTSCCRWSSA